MDKRHVDMKSTAMEKKALERALSRLKEVLDVLEISTDAFTTIKNFLVSYNNIASINQQISLMVINALNIISLKTLFKTFSLPLLINYLNTLSFQLTTLKMFSTLLTYGIKPKVSENVFSG